MNIFGSVNRAPCVRLLIAWLALSISSARAATPVSVPPEVAIDRPSSDVVTQAAEGLRQFLAHADPSLRAIVAKYPDLISVRPPRINPALVPTLNGAFFVNKHNAFVEIAKKGDIDLLFLGDSITDFWRNEGPRGIANPPRAGKVIFDKYFGAMKAANFGISGDHIAGVLYRLQNGEGQGFQPKAIMLMIGTNDASSAPFCSAPEIAEGIGAVVLELRKDFPAANILLLGIFPRGNPGDDVRKIVLDVNPLIARLRDVQHVSYLDIGDKFLDADGVLQRDIMSDKLHPNEKGYEIWAEAVKEPLAVLMK